jgi:hypothetical protein
VAAVPRAARGQDAAPSPSASPSGPTYEAWLTDVAVRNCEASSGSRGDQLYDYLFTDALLFDNDDHATAAFDEYVGRHFADRQEGPISFSDVARLSAPQIGDQSVATRATGTGSFEPHAYALTVIRVGSRIVSLEASTLRDFADTSELEILRDLVRIAQAIAPLEPSDGLPRQEGGLMVGGLFDVLPDFEDVPMGFTVWLEFPEE